VRLGGRRRRCGGHPAQVQGGQARTQKRWRRVDPVWQRTDEPAAVKGDERSASAGTRRVRYGAAAVVDRVRVPPTVVLRPTAAAQSAAATRPCGRHIPCRSPARDLPRGQVAAPAAASATASGSARGLGRTRGRPHARLAPVALWRDEPSRTRDVSAPAASGKQQSALAPAPAQLPGAGGWLLAPAVVHIHFGLDRALGRAALTALTPGQSRPLRS